MKGLYGKYVVRKRDGETDPDAQYRVLRIDTDPIARKVWQIYGWLVAAENPALACDVEEELRHVALEQARSEEWERCAQIVRDNCPACSNGVAGTDANGDAIECQLCGEFIRAIREADECN